MNHVELYHYEMAPDVIAFSTTRRGGCSMGCPVTESDACPSENYASFNINRYCGDSEEHVAHNRKVLCRQLGISDDCLIMPHQTHDTLVACINERFLSLSPEERQQMLEGIDALMTNMPGVCIGVSTADCIPLLLCDPQHQAVCAIHAGWRGTVARIAEKAVRAMTKAYGTRPSDLIAQIGPGISLDSFEVGQEVYDAFTAAGFDMPSISKRYAKWHLDLPECNRQQLIASGLMAGRIHLCGICTYKACDTFFSARRLGIHSGRIFTGIILPTRG